MHRTWDAASVTRALSALKDNGVSVREMTRLSGANRSTVYRWMSGGGGQPDYDLVNRLARGVWRAHPDLARELVEASGYAWAEPDLGPEPEPDIDPQVLEALRRAYKGEPEKLAEAVRVIGEVEAAASGRRGGGELPPGRRAG